MAYNDYGAQPNYGASGYGGAQASPAPIGPPQFGQWTTDFYDCSDVETCLMASMFPCVLHGQMTNVLDQGQTPCWLGAALVCTSQYRTKLREKYSLPQIPFDDGFSHIACFPCSVAQEYRELKLRGIHPALGYDAVKHIYELPSQLVPPQYQGMQYDIPPLPQPQPMPQNNHEQLSATMVFNAPSGKKNQKNYNSDLPPQGLSATTVFDVPSQQMPDAYGPPPNDLPPHGLSATMVFDAPPQHNPPPQVPPPRSHKELSATMVF